jgi:hypothetical protein
MELNIYSGMQSVKLSPSVFFIAFKLNLKAQVLLPSHG